MLLLDKRNKQLGDKIQKLIELNEDKKWWERDVVKIIGGALIIYAIVK